MGENTEKENPEIQGAQKRAGWHSASNLKRLDVMVHRAQKAHLDILCQRYGRSQGDMVREGLNILFSFYNEMEAKKESKK